MKKLLTLLLSLTLAIGCFSLVACDDGQGGGSTTIEEGFVYELVEGETEEESYLKVTGYNVSDEVNTLVSQQNFTDEKVKAVSKIQIPSEKVEYKRNGQVVGSYPVKEIAESAFSGMLFIKEVVIPKNVETVGNACLAGLANLEKLTVSFVGNKLEGNVNSAKTLGYLFGTTTFTNGVSATVKYNASGSTTVYVPSALKTVVLTDGEVSEYAFNGMSTLQEIVLPESVTAYGKYAFENCTSLYKFTVGSQVTTINEGAFKGCTTLVNVGLDNASALTYIGDQAFSGATQLFYNANGSTYKPSASLTYIGVKAFSGLTALETVDLSDLSGKTVTVKESAFSGLTNLKSVTMPADNSNITYGNLVFAGCKLEQKDVKNYQNLYLFDFDYNA